VQRLLWLAHKAIADKDEIRATLDSATNPVVKAILAIVDDVNANVKEVHQRRSFQELAEFLLWIYYRDTAYRDQGDYALFQLLSKADELKAVLAPKLPEDWYIEQWHNAKEMTARGRRLGILAENEVSLEESFFSDGSQLERLRRFMDGKDS
jgi:hypothetical protein